MYGFSEMMMEEAEKQFSQEGRETMTSKERLAIREAIHAMKWLDKHYDGWGLEEECAILENICSNCGENEIKSNHNYLDLQYQLDSAEAEVSKLQSEIKKNKEELSDYWQVHDEQVTIIKTQTYEIKRLQNEIDIIKKRSEHNDLQDAASARQQMDIIKRLREEIKILKLGEKTATVDKDVLKSILMDIANIVGKVSIAANCGGDFDPNDCDVNTCEYFYDCVRQKALLQKIEKL